MNEFESQETREIHPVSDRTEKYKAHFQSATM